MQYSYALTGAALVATAAAGEYAAPSSTTCTESTLTPVYSAPEYKSTVAPIYTSAPVYTPAPVYTTKYYSSYETYCPEATSLTVAGKTYTVSSATTLTIEDCSCTLTHAMTSTAAPAVSTGAVSQISDHQPQAPVSAGVSSAPVSAAPVATGAVSQISDHQPQAPVSAPASAAPVATGAVSQISDHQPQAPVSAPASVAPAAPAATYAPAAAAPVYSNSTGGAAPSGTITGKPATYTGAASKAFTASGAGLAAVFGLVAYIL